MKLKKRHIFTIAACAIAALFFTCVLAIGLSAEPSKEPLKPVVRDHENSLTIDPAEDEVESLDIRWLTGPVTVGISPDGLVHVTERSSKALSESDRMKAELSGGELKVSWDGQWFRRFINFNLGWFGQREKELEVLLPRELSQELESVSLSNTGDTISITGCRAEDISVSAVSGELSINSCQAGEVRADSVSGGIALSDVSASEALTVNTVSGGMELTAINCDGAVTLDTVSGTCRLIGGAREIQANTVSGDMTLTLSGLPELIDMDSVSGSLTAELPQNPGFTAEHDSVSGSFKCAFPTQDLGGGRERYGDGKGMVRMNTTSGGMEIRRGG